MRLQTTLIAVILGSLVPSLAAAFEKVPIAKVVPAYMDDDLELAITPWPQESKLSDQMVAASALVIEETKDYAHGVTLKDAKRWADALTAGDKPKDTLKVYIGEVGDGGPADQALQKLKLVPAPEKRTAMGEQGYLLFVGSLPDSDEAIVAVAGIGAAGTYYGLQSLKQLTAVKDGKIYVRAGTLVDWPALPWRGSKRPLAWEELYKANFGFLRGDDNKEHFRVALGAGADPQRGLKSWELKSGAKTTASRGLDASDAMIDAIFEQWEADYKKTGNLLFTIKGDDIELSLDEKSGTRKRFDDNCGAAYRHLLTELNRRLKKLDARCTLYWMPNPYYTVNWDFERLSRQVREAGGLPSEIGLWWTGHYVYSPVMTAADISGYQKAFYGDNPIKVRGLIYDNHGRIDEAGRLADFFAMPARDPEIAKYLNGLSNERGSWVNRITSYDFQWNPHAYKPERSLKLAVRELTNRDPDYYRLLMQFIQTWETGRYPGVKETTHEAIAAQQKGQVAKLLELRPKIKAAGEQALKSSVTTWDTRDGDFRKQFVDQVANNIGQKDGLLQFLDWMWRDADAPAYTIAAADAPKIDGKLDEACYQKKPTFERFVTPGGKMVDADKKTLWEVPLGFVPDDIATQGWFFADDKNFYLAFRCKDKLYERPPGQKPPAGPSEREKIGNDHVYCWRNWCLDINLDVKHDRVNMFHLIFDPLGQVYDEYLGWPGDKLPTGPTWSIGDNYKVVRDGDSWTVEAAIPLEKLGLKQVKPGDVWGTNVYRSGMNVTSMFSLLKDTGPYGVRYPNVFGQVQWK